MPSVLTLLACYGSLQQFDLSGLRTVIFAGEVFPPKYLARLMAELPHPRYLNWYGPTETNVCTAFEVPAGGADARPVPIGKACANTEVFAVTSEGRRVSRPGEVGELYVRGPSLMRGYWGQPAKTSEALVRNPFRAEYDELVYRTGDLVTLESARELRVSRPPGQHGEGPRLPGGAGGGGSHAVPAPGHPGGGGAAGAG